MLVVGLGAGSARWSPPDREGLATAVRCLAEGLLEPVGGVAHGVLLLLWLTTFVVAVSSLAAAETDVGRLLVADLCRR